jgi:hypothetical protein
VPRHNMLAPTMLAALADAQPLPGPAGPSFVCGDLGVGRHIHGAWPALPSKAPVVSIST